MLIVEVKDVPTLIVPKLDGLADMEKSWGDTLSCTVVQRTGLPERGQQYAEARVIPNCIVKS